MPSIQHSGHPSDDDGRQNRFQNHTATENGSGSLRERAASQPPRSSEQGFLSSPSTQHFVPSSLGGNRSPWPTQRILTPNRSGLPQPVPIRSSSFSSNPQSHFSSTMRERAFPSTFEDDESEGLSEDTYDELYVPPSLSRGRVSGHDYSRSRSQSLATTTTRSGLATSPFHGGSSAMQSWNESFLSNSLNIPGQYGDIKPPGTSRYGSLGTLGRSPNIHSSSPSGGSVVGNGYSSTHQQATDMSNMSPFVRDVGQILLDDRSALRGLWAGMHPPRDENAGGGSGTTSRRHSVSVVQPRRGNVVGFNVPGGDGPDEPTRPPLFQSSIGGRGGLMLSDDDLASDLGLLNINSTEPPQSSSSHPTSQPASLPIYAPLSRTPPSQDILSQYQSINLSIPGGKSRPLGTPSDGGSGNSPSRNTFDQHFGDVQYSNGRHNSTSGQGKGQPQQSELMARFIPGQGIQYLPQQHGTPNQSGGSTYTRARAYSNTLPSPISPTTSNRVVNPQQPPFYAGQLQRRPSDGGQGLAELGKGVPLHAVPASWPLFIVEFKAGRTDLFYLTDLSQDIRVGDLVIVEADRGKDLGKVVNDSITLAEVDAFQKQQTERAGDAQASSPGGAGSGTAGAMGKKEINPKMIYGKAQPQDAKYVVCRFCICAWLLTEFFTLASWLRKCRMSSRLCSYARAKSAQRSCRWR